MVRGVASVSVALLALTEVERNAALGGVIIIILVGWVLLMTFWRRK